MILIVFGRERSSSELLRYGDAALLDGGYVQFLDSFDLRRCIQDLWFIHSWPAAVPVVLNALRSV